MPLKEATESDFLRLFADTGVAVEVHWLRLRSHVPKHASQEHMDSMYEYWDALPQVPDGLVVTGAPVEQLEFGEVTYWPELCRIMEWARREVKSVIYVCWAAQAALWHHYGIRKYGLKSKMFGIFPQEVLVGSSLFDGLAPAFMMPHSRHTEIRRGDIAACADLTIAADSDVTGPSVITALDGREIYITGHIEYATHTLDTEYQRDQLRGRTDVGLPIGYYPADDPSQPPVDTWHAPAVMFYRNWLDNLKNAKS